MLRYLLKSKQGIFLLVGVVFLVIGLAISTFNESVSRYTFYLSILFLGFFATKNAIHETLSERKLNVDLLMILAAVGACMIQYESEGAILLFIFSLSGLLEEYANKHSSNAIEALMCQVPSTAQKILSNGEIIDVKVASLKINDVIMVAKGAQIPIDGKVDREVVINESALTGESLPVTKLQGEEVFAGTINEGNSFQLTVGKLVNETVFSNIIQLVEEAQSRPSKISTIIDRIESKYVIGVLVGVPLLIAILYFGQGLAFEEAFYRGMVFLTVASPCALVASATPVTLAAISNGAKYGVVFKGGVVIEALASMTQLFSDKTGTLTYGHFEVINYDIPIELLSDVVYMEQYSTHPIAKAIVSYFNRIDLSKADDQTPVVEIAGKGLKKGDLFIGKLDDSDEEINEIRIKDGKKNHQSTVYIKLKEKIVGYIILEDEIRPEAKTAVNHFQENGVKVSLLTGDQLEVAESVAKKVGIKHIFAELLPKDKIEHIQMAQKNDSIIGMIGDGINDAPALANADIGIAMGSGSSIAMESADIVMVKNDLNKLFYSFLLSKKLNLLIKQNIIFAITVILLLVVLNLFGVLPLPIAVICHEGSTILVILNGLRLLREKP